MDTPKADNSVISEEKYASKLNYSIVLRAVPYKGHGKKCVFSRG